MRAAPAWPRRHLALLSHINSLRIKHSYYIAPFRFSSQAASVSKPPSDNVSKNDGKNLVQTRDLTNTGFQHYPRLSSSLPLSSQAFEKSYSGLENGATDTNEVRIAGRISAIRTAGSRLIFIDIQEQTWTSKVQVVLARNHLGSDADITSSKFKEVAKNLQKGDVIAVSGNPHRTESGELSVRALELPSLLSPCLHLIPDSKFGENADVAHETHVEMLSRPRSIHTLLTRSTIVNTMQSFLASHHFVTVQTPVLAANAGGAIARPFETTATEFADRKLALRIAPELWLKRLIIGGMAKVAEIGPVFRNEGLDKTHNPEFTTCEFYAAYWNLQKLQHETQQMVNQIARAVAPHLNELDESCANIIDPDDDSPWTEIDFIPALHSAMDVELPNLAEHDARDQLLQLFESRELPLPSKPTLPRLLDKLASIYLEPQCHKPTWIINTPECMSPLAKSFIHPTAPNGQPVAARAELFIREKEIVNCYEEENSPFEQRRKFEDQRRLARLPCDDGASGTETVDIQDDEAMKLDEDYLRALEWGLPPTGGWGCGIDRLVMLFTGSDKISDVLSFGNLRQVTRGAERFEK